MATISSPWAAGSNPPLFSDTWSNTQLSTMEFSHKWTIHNFSFCKKEFGQCIDSPTFSRVVGDHLKWRLRLYPGGHDERHKNSIVIFMGLASCDGSEVTAKYELSILNALNEKTFCSETIKTFPPATDISTMTFFGTFVPINEVKELLYDGELTIFCEIAILDEIFVISGKSDGIAPFNVAESSMLCTDVRPFLGAHQFSDVIITVKGKDIHAHKMILAACSPVFLAMFQSEMKDKKQSRVEINDIDPEVFMEMLRFMYTNETSNIEKMANGLLAASEKYALESLKVLCAEALNKNLKINNAADILILAHLHNVDKLKIKVMNFICEHAKDIVDSAAFKRMVNLYPYLSIEMFRALAIGNSDHTISSPEEKKNKRRKAL